MFIIYFQSCCRESIVLFSFPQAIRRPHFLPQECFLLATLKLGVTGESVQSVTPGRLGPPQLIDAIQVYLRCIKYQALSRSWKKKQNISFKHLLWSEMKKESRKDNIHGNSPASSRSMGSVIGKQWKTPEAGVRRGYTVKWSKRVRETRSCNAISRDNREPGTSPPVLE